MIHVLRMLAGVGLALAVFLPALIAHFVFGVDFGVAVLVLTAAPIVVMGLYVMGISVGEEITEAWRARGGE